MYGRAHTNTSSMNIQLYVQCTSCLDVKTWLRYIHFLPSLPRHSLFPDSGKHSVRTMLPSLMSGARQMAAAQSRSALRPAVASRQQVRHRSNRSRRGLYDGKDIRSGNNVPFSLKKTKRKFKPNVFEKAVYSETLDEMVRFHLTASALRSIDKAGGLDNYLLTSPHVASGEGLEAKRRILRCMAIESKRAKNQAAQKAAAVAADGKAASASASTAT